MSKVLKALALARMQMGRAKKSSDNPFFRSKYADLTEVIEVVEDAAHEQGLAVFQKIDSDRIVTVIVHAESGETFELPGAPIVVKEANNPQAYGSAITYARRYSLACAFNMAQEDDDGNAATGNRQQQQAHTRAKTLDAKGIQALKDRIAQGQYKGLADIEVSMKASGYTMTAAQRTELETAFKQRK